MSGWFRVDQNPGNVLSIMACPDGHVGYDSETVKIILQSTVLEPFSVIPITLELRDVLVHKVFAAFTRPAMWKLAQKMALRELLVERKLEPCDAIHSLVCAASTLKIDPSGRKTVNLEDAWSEGFWPGVRTARLANDHVSHLKTIEVSKASVSVLLSLPSSVRHVKLDRCRYALPTGVPPLPHGVKTLSVMVDEYSEGRLDGGNLKNVEELVLQGKSWYNFILSGTFLYLTVLEVTLEKGTINLHPHVPALRELRVVRQGWQDDSVKIELPPSLEILCAPKVLIKNLCQVHGLPEHWPRQAQVSHISFATVPAVACKLHHEIIFQLPPFEFATIRVQTLDDGSNLVPPYFRTMALSKKLPPGLLILNAIRDFMKGWCEKILILTICGRRRMDGRRRLPRMPQELWVLIRKEFYGEDPWAGLVKRQLHHRNGMRSLYVDKGASFDNPAVVVPAIWPRGKISA